MTTKRTNKKAPQQPVKQSHYYDVLSAIEFNFDEIMIRLGYERTPQFIKNSMIAGIILPPEIKDESPCLYFDFSRMTLPEVDETLQRLRGAADIYKSVNAEAITIYNMIKSRFPPVKLA